MPDKKRIGLAMLGNGFIARTHNNAFKTIPYMFWPNDFEIDMVSVCDLTDEGAKEAKERYGYRKAYSDFKMMLADPDVTLFDNCGPDPVHFEPVMEAIKHGKNVICEKPLAMSAAQSKKMLDAAMAAGIKHTTMFNYRFFPAITLAKTLLEKGALGQVNHFRGSYTQPYGADVDIPYEDIWYNNTGRTNGVGQGIGCHVIDLSRYLMGEVKAIVGRSKTYVDTRKDKRGIERCMDCEEGMLAVADFSSGATGIYEALESAAGRRNYFVWEILGSDGSMEWNLENPNFLRVYLKNTTVQEVTGFTEISVTQSSANHPYSDVWWPSGHNIGWEHGHINAIAHFLSCIASGEQIGPNGATFFDGYRAEVVLEAIKESSVSDKRIFI